MDQPAFIGTLGGSLLAASLAAGAQPAKKIIEPASSKQVLPS